MNADEIITKDIICLANSIKLNAKCVAGKDSKSYEWIRPISDTIQGELSDKQILLKDGHAPQLLDIIRIHFKKKTPKYYQPENVLIDDVPWEKVGSYPLDQLDKLCDDPQEIWVNDKPDSKKISLAFLEMHPTASSLLFIKPDLIQIQRTNFDKKKNFRALFSYKNIKYDLPITDPLIRREFESKTPGTYPLTEKSAYLCLSIGEPYKREYSSEEPYCYKLVAAIIKFI